jgi:hypothetical protein
MFEGIDKDGERVNRGWRIGYHNIPQLQWKYVSSDPQNANSTQIRIPQHNWRYFSAEEGGIRIYEMPYSKETFFAMMKHAQSQDPTDKSNGISLSFFKSGASNPMSIQSIEQFTTDNFEEEWEKLIAPPAAKDLKNFVEEFRKQNQTQNNSSQADFLKQFVEEFRRQSNNEAGGHGEHYQ